MSLQKSLNEIVDGGGNLGRFAALRRRAEVMGLIDRLRTEPIDWFSAQENMIVDIPGGSPQTIYVVAHYDKTDSNPLKMISLLMNGALDELISFSFFSDGAIDNATGIAVALELASVLNQQKSRYSYRFLFPGSEESGLRGSRAHLARLSAEEKDNILLAVNIDSVGVNFARNCVSNDNGSSDLVEQAMNSASSLNLDLGQESGSVSDSVPFKESGAWNDVLLGFRFNYIGGLLPQRSWFSQPFSVPVVNFTACGLVEPWNDIFGMLFVPFGKIHGMQDRLDQISISRLNEQFQIIQNFLGVLDNSYNEQLLFNKCH